MIQVGVFRIFGNELENPVDDNKVALELHNVRKQALHEVFDNQQTIEISDWGQTDDSQPHEFVSIAISIGAVALTDHVLIPAEKFIFEKIADNAIDTVFEKSIFCGAGGGTFAAVGDVTPSVKCLKKAIKP